MNAILPQAQRKSRNRQAGERVLKLMGQPSLGDYVHFFRTRVIDGEHIAERDIADEWRRANDIYYAMLIDEAGVAETIEDHAPPASLRAAAARLQSEAFFQQTYDSMPVEIRWVELAKLVVSQSSVGLDHSRTLRKELGSAPDRRKLFDFCMAPAQSAPVRMVQLSGDHYVFSSPSTDFRFHDSQLLSGGLAAQVRSFGPVVAGLLLPLGFGSNLMSAIGSENRIVLQNGYHRAFSLLAHGVTHAPMVVERVTRLDELHHVGSDKLSDDPAHYFRSPRPPLLKDFLDPRLARKVRVHPLETRVEIEFKVRTSTGPAARVVA